MEFALQGVRLFSPLPLSSSKIPGFVRIDTAVLMQLFMADSRTFKDFADLIELNHGWKLRDPHDRSKMPNTAHRDASLSALLGGRAVTQSEELLFKSAKWCFFAPNLETWNPASKKLECPERGGCLTLSFLAVVFRMFIPYLTLCWMFRASGPHAGWWR